jgi:integrase
MTVATGALVVRAGADGEPFYEAKWRYAGWQVKRRVGPAWLERTAAGAGKVRRGRVAQGWYDEKQATVRMAELVAEHAHAMAAAEDELREQRERGVTVRELAAEWLGYLVREKGVKPSTLLDRRYLLAEPGTPHKRGGGRSPGRIIGAFGDMRLRSVTTQHVAAFLRGLDRGGMSARWVNAHRQVLSAMFGYACRGDTYALAVNPVSATSKRRELPAAVLDYYEPDEIEALARAAHAGGHRAPSAVEVAEDERWWRAWEDHRDGELYRVAAYTGMRLGELLALRWGDVDLAARRVIVHRAVSAGVEGPTKSWQARFVPLADNAASALARLAVRGDYTSRDDYVFCSRLGRRLDGSALRRRYKAARKAAGLRPLRFHSLRHAAGSLVAREAGAHFVQAFLGHSRLSTTERYLHAKARPEDVALLNRAFAAAGAAAVSGIRDAR